MKFFILCLTILLFFHTVSAQIKPEVETVYGCDTMLVIFDHSASELMSAADKSSPMIIVAYAGREEKSKTIVQQRLKALEFIYVKKRGFSKERIVLAEGRRREGLAKVEFYIGGKLHDALFFSKNQPACTNCCPNEYEYIR